MTADAAPTSLRDDARVDLRAGEERRRRAARRRRRDRGASGESPGGGPTMPPSTKRSKPAAISRDGRRCDRVRIDVDAVELADCRGDVARGVRRADGEDHVRTSAQARRCSSRRSSPAACARAPSPSLRPSDAHSTSIPRCRNTAPIAAPISPGWSRPTTSPMTEVASIRHDSRRRRRTRDAAAADGPAARPLLRHRRHALRHGPRARAAGVARARHRANRDHALPPRPRRRRGARRERDGRDRLPGRARLRAVRARLGLARLAGANRRLVPDAGRAARRSRSS